MASDLYHRYETDGDVSMADVRAALESLSDDDVSVSSPISPGAAGVGTALDEGDVVIRVEGQGGDWTKTSEDALRRAVSGVNGVSGLVESEGGYDGE